tara:strand:+ start:27236 stop:27745 length:510 start_codon:yes stop_codon:yes gene_type:complete
MISIEQARPTVKMLLNHIEAFEAFCMGEQSFSPAKFRELNEELSVGAVLMIGKYRYQKAPEGKHLLWRGLDNREYDLGLVNDANVMRDYPGFHAKRSLSLGNDMVKETKIISAPHGRGNLSMVILEDGSTGIAPNYRMALRNATMKMHLTSKFNYFSLSNIWNKVWGHA